MLFPKSITIITSHILLLPLGSLVGTKVNFKKSGVSLIFVGDIVDNHMPTLLDHLGNSADNIGALVLKENNGNHSSDDSQPYSHYKSLGEPMLLDPLANFDDDRSVEESNRNRKRSQDDSP